MEIEKEHTEMDVNYLTLPHAEGTIEAKEHQQERLDEFTEALSNGEFHVASIGSIPAICVDGRPNGYHLLPNAAGGSETLFVADDLLFKRFEGENRTTLEGYKKVLTFLRSLGLEIGGHTDDHHDEGMSGCGANDHLSRIYDFICRNGSKIKSLAEKLGLTVPTEIHDLIVTNATERTAFSSGDEMLDELKSYDTAIVEELVGAHNEVVAVINMRKNTTLDREALRMEFGDDYQAFNVDAWSFEEAARKLLGEAATDEEVNVYVIAMVYYNLATTHVLAGKNLRVVVLN